MLPIRSRGLYMNRVGQAYRGPAYPYVTDVENR